MFKYNTIVNDCLKIDHEKAAMQSKFLFYIIKELYDYLNLKTKDSILIVKLRKLVKQRKEYKHKIDTLKKYWKNMHIGKNF